MLLKHSISGLHIKPDKQLKSVPVVGAGAPGSVVQGARTAVIMGADTGHSGDHVPGVDLDMVAASMSEMSHDQVTMSQPGPKQLGKSLAAVLSGD